MNRNLIKHVACLIVFTGFSVSVIAQQRVSYIDDGVRYYFDKPETVEAKSGKEVQSQQMAFTSSNLPLVKIITHGVNIPDDPKVVVDFGIIDNGPGAMNKLTDSYKYFGKIGIEIRGQSSQMFPKKQYGFELRTPKNADTSVSLLGLPKESDWILSAPYTDKTFLRDAMTYYLGRRLGEYAPRTVFCELFIDSDYKGVYVLTEKIKKDNDRVNVSTLKITDVTGDDLTGGYIVKIDKGDYNDYYGWYMEKMANDHPIFMAWEYPKPENIVAQQKNYIKKFITDFENALDGSNYKDPVNGYRKYIDVKSFVDFLIVNELGRNVDGYRLSSYFHKDKDTKGGKLKAGPLWDFNLAYGNADYYSAWTTDSWIFENPDESFKYDGYQTPFWWSRLMSDSYFTNELYCRWKKLRNGVLHEDSIAAYIDGNVDYLSQAQVRNYQRWPDVLGNYIWPNYYIGQTYQDEINYMKDWIFARIQWMDDNIIGVCNPTGVNFANSIDVLNVYPNPLTDKSLVEFKLEKPINGSLDVYNVLGEKVTVKAGLFKAGLNVVRLNRSVIKGGVFVLKLSSEGSVLGSVRLVKL